MDQKQFIEDKINHYAQMIIDRSDKFDDMAIGELSFYMSLRRILNGRGTIQDKGMMDAINDFLQEKGIIESNETFYSK